MTRRRQSCQQGDAGVLSTASRQSIYLDRETDERHKIDCILLLFLLGRLAGMSILSRRSTSKHASERRSSATFWSASARGAYESLPFALIYDHELAVVGWWRIWPLQEDCRSCRLSIESMSTYIALLRFMLPIQAVSTWSLDMFMWHLSSLPGLLCSDTSSHALPLSSPLARCLHLAQDPLRSYYSHATQSNMLPFSSGAQRLRDLYLYLRSIGPCLQVQLVVPVKESVSGSITRGSSRCSPSVVP